MVEYDEYYQNPKTWEIIAYQCKYREVAIFKYKPDGTPDKIRPLKIFKPEHFKAIYDIYDLKDSKFDIYITNSCVRLPMLKTGSYKNIEESQEIVNALWKKFYAGEYPDLVSQYDFFIDIDINGPDEIETALGWSKTLRKNLEQKIGYIETWHTGGGIHLLHKKINFTPDEIKEMIVDVCTKNKIPLFSDTKTKPCVDNGVYQYRRLRRVPYSIHSKTGKKMEKIKLLNKTL